MSERAPDALPPDVAALVKLERGAPPALDDARARVAARLGLDGVPSAPPAAAAGGWGSFAVPLTVVALAAAGAGIWLASRSSTDVAPTARPAPVVREQVVAPPTPPTPAVTVTPRESPGAPPRARTPAAPETEVSLLASARKALAAGNARSALALVRRHERTWPRGELVQEREVVAMQALVASGAVDEARARADAFLRRFPGSTLIETVRQLRDATARAGTKPMLDAP